MEAFAYMSDIFELDRNLIDIITKSYKGRDTLDQAFMGMELVYQS